MKTPQVESLWAVLLLLSVTAIAAADPQPESKPPDKSKEKPYELTFHVVTTGQKRLPGHALSLGQSAPVQGASGSAKICLHRSSPMQKARPA
jgi:hypothetical protein